MFEVPLFFIALGLFLCPQIIAGLLAKSQGRKFWFWFFISFLIPIISIVVLLCMKDKNPDKRIKLADHVDRENR
jgi:cytochrome c biogenesis factor